MEDTNIASLNMGDGNSFFGVFDGHGGIEVAKYVKKHVVKELLKQKSYKHGNFKEALENTFLHIDKRMQGKAGDLQYA